MTPRPTASGASLAVTTGSPSTASVGPRMTARTAASQSPNPGTSQSATRMPSTIVIGSQSASRRIGRALLPVLSLFERVVDADVLAFLSRLDDTPARSVASLATPGGCCSIGRARWVCSPRSGRAPTGRTWRYRPASARSGGRRPGRIATHSARRSCARTLTSATGCKVSSRRRRGARLHDGRVAAAHVQAVVTPSLNFSQRSSQRDHRSARIRPTSPFQLSLPRYCLMRS